jgi:hypothetical protein
VVRHRVAADATAIDVQFENLFGSVESPGGRRREHCIVDSCGAEPPPATNDTGRRRVQVGCD